MHARRGMNGGASVRDLNRLRLVALCAAAQRCHHIETILMGIVDAGVLAMDHGLHVRSRKHYPATMPARQRHDSAGSKQHAHAQQREPSPPLSLQARDLSRNGGFIAAALARTLSAALSAQLLRLHRPAILAASIPYDSIREVTSRVGTFHEGVLDNEVRLRPPHGRARCRRRNRRRRPRRPHGCVLGASRGPIGRVLAVCARRRSRTGADPQSSVVEYATCGAVQLRGSWPLRLLAALKPQRLPPWYSTRVDWRLHSRGAGPTDAACAHAGRALQSTILAGHASASAPAKCVPAEPVLEWPLRLGQ